MKLNKQSLSNENGGLCALFWGSWLWSFFVAFNGSFHLFIYMYVSQLQIATTKERAHARARTHTHTQCMYRCTRGKMHARADSLAPCDLCLKAARKILVKTKTKNNKHFLVFEYNGIRYDFIVHMGKFIWQH